MPATWIAGGFAVGRTALSCCGLTDRTPGRFSQMFRDFHVQRAAETCWRLLYSLVHYPKATQKQMLSRLVMLYSQCSPSFIKWFTKRAFYIEVISPGSFLFQGLPSALSEVLASLLPLVFTLPPLKKKFLKIFIWKQREREERRGEEGRRKQRRGKWRRGERRGRRMEGTGGERRGERIFTLLVHFFPKCLERLGQGHARSQEPYLDMGSRDSRNWACTCCLLSSEWPRYWTGLEEGLDLRHW